MLNAYQPSNEIAFSSLLRRALVGLFAIGAAVLLGYGAYSYQQERETLFKELSLQAQFVAASSEEKFDSVGTSLSLVAHSLHGPLDPHAYDAAFRDLLTHHPEIKALTLFDPDGRLLYSTIPRPGKLSQLPPKREASVRFNADLQSGSLYSIGRTGVGRGLGTWRIPIRYVIRGTHGEPRMVLQAAIPVEQQTALWAGLPLMPNTLVGLIRDDQYLEARWPVPSPNDVYTHALKPSGVSAAILKRLPTGFYDSHSPITHEARIGAYQRLPHLPLTAYVSVLKSEIWSNWREHNEPLLIASLICSVAFMVFAGLLLQREKGYRKALWAQASTDNLTELPSRIAAEDYLARRIRQSEAQHSQFAVVFIDLDKFKIINDSMGHDCGDQVLKEAAGRLKSVIRGRDLLARLGGDEFIAVISCSNILSAQRVAERLADAMKKPFYVQGKQFYLSLSIGISFYEKGVSASQLMREADLAMYTIKNTSRNGFAFFNESMDEQVNSQVELQQQLSDALERGEFRLFYQPKYNAGGQIVGAEALLRWQHPERGLLTPGLFINQAEESGLIVPIGIWVLDEACRQIKKWQQKGLAHRRISVNVSARQFGEKGFVEQVGEILTQAGINPSLLEIEITESMLANDLDGMKHQLEELEQLGVFIALDDFGTGYSSLSYLRQFPIHGLKIDRSFVHDITIDPHDAELTNAIIAMGHALKISVIAEGVETAEQLAYLKKCQCDEFQGYYFSTPVTAKELEQLMRAEAIPA
jgi:diguanylate cyclase (GGDEF)-like protein